MKPGGAGGRIPPGRFTPGGMDIPDEYPDLPDGSKVPFTPRSRPRPDAEDRERVLTKHRHGAEEPRKTMFRPDWSDSDIMDAIDLASAIPESFVRKGDKIVFERVVDGELVLVQIRTDGSRGPRFWSAYPPDGILAK